MLNILASHQRRLWRNFSSSDQLINYTEIFRGVKSLKDGLHCFPWLWQHFSFLLYFLQAPAFAFLHDEKTVGLEIYFSNSRWFSPTGSYLSAGLGLHGQALDHLPRHREVLHLHSLHWHTPGITGSQEGFHHSFSYFLPEIRDGIFYILLEIFQLSSEAQILWNVNVDTGD